MEEKGALIQLMHTRALRSVLTEIFSEVTSPKPLANLESLKQIADVMKFILTLFVHEQSNDYKLLYTILESS